MSLTLRRRMRRPGVAALTAAVLLAGATAACGDDPGPSGTSTVKVGVLVIAQAKVLDETVAAFEAHLRDKLPGRQVTFDVKNANGDSALIQTIARDLVGSDATMFAVIGTPAVVALAKLEQRRPIIAIAMGDPVGAGLAASLDKPGRNVTGSIDYVDPALLLAKLALTDPKPRTIGTVYDPSNANMQLWVKDLKAAVKANGLQLVEATIGGPGDIATAARSLVGRADTILIGPDANVFAGLASIGATAVSNKLPLYVVAGDATVDGVLASLGPDYPAIGRLAGDAASAVSTGTPAGDVPFGRPGAVQWSVNPATASKVAVTLPTEATAGS
ncbi:ABC transporter substrate-binding protein [Dactylosporangium sp. AC04546]|uniref:ABC transporter substrate-binding protein n=1 Tax=Dactylosporangium sp. AC04546 TaxID=2862460 RepID=UPI001EDDF057|nr:ABC transporter substrate-binding protein [Dactylosporangium sp. AC04546]WVK89003.1 ABC transporter substrate-binding protein [Dactylosporangium sp. AC04546]